MFQTASTVSIDGHGGGNEIIPNEFQVWGPGISLSIRLCGLWDHFGKRENLTMKTAPRTTQSMARKAFGLLLELRDRENAYQLLSQAIACLEMLGREKEISTAPVMLSIRVMQLRKS